MRLLTDERAQSIQIGAVLLFAVLIILLSTWQAFVVPNQNEEIEFNHNEDAQQQMTELRTNVNSMPDATSIRSTTIDLGVRYPSRTIFRNPPPASGTIRTIGTEDEGYAFTVDNATATNEKLDQLWNRTNATYGTGAIEYRPSYSEYRSAPRTVYEHSVLYNRFDREERELAVTGQSLVRGDRISLVALNGSLRENRIDSTSVDFEPLSTRTRVVEIEPDGGPITLELPTRMAESEWQEVFESEMTGNGGAVLDVRTTEAAESDEFSTLELTLENGTYSLQLAKVGLGVDTTQTEPSYLTAVDGQGSTLDEGDTQELTVEVRDDYNKPLRGTTVTANATDGSVEKTSETGNDGQATFEYNTSGLSLSPGQERTDEINFTITEGYEPDSTHDDQSPENLTMEVAVQREETTSSGGADRLPGPRPTNLTLADDTVVEGGTLDIINASFDNQGNTSFNRGGTDVVAGEYYVVEGNVTDPNDGETVVRGSLDEGSGLPLTTTEDRDLTLNMTGTIDTASPDSLDLGNYTVFIRGQDTRGIWTNESLDGYTGESFEVTDADIDYGDETNYRDGSSGDAEQPTDASGTIENPSYVNEDDDNSATAISSGSEDDLKVGFALPPTDESANTYEMRFVIDDITGVGGGSFGFYLVNSDGDELTGRQELEEGDNTYSFNDTEEQAISDNYDDLILIIDSETSGSGNRELELNYFELIAS